MKVSIRLIVPLLLIASLLAACGTGGAATEVPAVEQPTQDTAPEPTELATEAAEAFSVTVTDGLGRAVTLDSRPQRIVSATLGTDEILLDLVGPERLIAVSHLADEAATSNIADHPLLPQIEHVIETGPDPEQIISLEPDLVFVASFTDAAVLKQLDDAGVTYFALGDFTSIEAMQQNILTIGDLVGEPDIAAGLVAEMEAIVTRIYDTVYSIETERPSVLYLSTDGWVAGANTTVDDIVVRAGGVNAAAHLNGWNQVSAEAIIEINPDVVILSPYVTDEEFKANPAFASLDAVMNGRVYPITDAHMSAVSQYIVLGVVDLAKLLYPDIFPEG